MRERRRRGELARIDIGEGGSGALYTGGTSVSDKEMSHLRIDMRIDVNNLVIVRKAGFKLKNCSEYNGI